MGANPDLELNNDLNNDLNNNLNNNQEKNNIINFKFKNARPIPKIPEEIEQKVGEIENELKEIKSCIDNYEGKIIILNDQIQDENLKNPIFLEDSKNAIFLEDKITALQDKIVNTIYDYREQLDIYTDFLSTTESDFSSVTNSSGIGLLLLISRIIGIKAEIETIIKSIAWLDEQFNFLNNEIMNVLSGDPNYINKCVVDSFDKLKDRSNKYKSLKNAIQKKYRDFDRFKEIGELLGKNR